MNLFDLLVALETVRVTKVNKACPTDVQNVMAIHSIPSPRDISLV